MTISPLKKWLIITFSLFALFGGVYFANLRWQMSLVGKNRLAEEKSPYLQQHKNNPVHWQPWSNEVFEIAKKLNKPIFLSIGYSTCHWCHVMEHESFENEGVAQVLNKYFISIKVDREERPDVDTIYMDAVQAMTGRGGWPMSVFLTPDRKPFFGGTYYPKNQFVKILRQIGNVWENNPDKLLEASEQLLKTISRQTQAAQSTSWPDDIFHQLVKKADETFDWEEGGHKGQMKFPPGYELRMLLRIHRRSGNEKALKMARFTLDKMAAGGIYDHMGGGFHRYSTDPRWLEPHFEKMLYDQASMTNAYLEAFQVTGHKEYELVAREILDYVLRDMTHPEGGFYSAEDADSEGKEGKFYVWREDELSVLLSKKEFSEFNKAFGISKKGNFEHNANILELQKGHSKAKRADVLKEALEKLFKFREKRVHPYKDTKVLTSWNGLMIAAMARAAQVFGDERYKEGAIQAAEFVLKNLKDKKGNLLRRWIDGETKFVAYLDDYAFLIDALIEVYQLDFDMKWIEEAKRLQELQDTLFWDEEKGGYYFSDGSDKTLLLRSKELMDNVRPAGNSVSALNLLRLSDFYYENLFKERAIKVLSSIPERLTNYPTAFPQLMMALDYLKDRSKEIAVVAVNLENGKKFIQALQAPYNPNKVISLGTAEEQALPLLKNKSLKKGETTVYICENSICKLPTTDIKEALKLAGVFEKY